MQKSKLVYLLHLLLMAIPTLGHANQSLRNVDGTLEITIKTPLPNQKAPANVIEYALLVRPDLRYALHIQDKMKNKLIPGSTLHIQHGSLTHDVNGQATLNVANKDISVIKSHTFSHDSIGRHSALVILVNFNNQPNYQPWSIQQVRNTVFNDVNAMFSEFSYQQTFIYGDVAGWLTVPLNNNGDCSAIANQIPGLLNAKLRKRGFNPDNYQHKIYLFPQIANCDWAGRGTLNGGVAWINGWNRSDVIAHELGHNFGLYHANSVACQDATFEANCQRTEYGDYADTMGYPYDYPNAHFNAFQKERLHWLNGNGTPTIQTITTSGIYSISPYETFTMNNKALKILKRIRPDHSEDYYYLEFRTGLGFDSNLDKCTDCNFTKGLLIHQGNSGNPNSSDLLNMSANKNNQAKTAALLPGESYTDNLAANNGVKITLLSINEVEALVKIDFGQTG